MANLKRSSTAKTHSEAALPPVPLDRAEQIRKAIEGLAASGGGEVAYMRDFRAADLRNIFPQTAELHPSVKLYALFAADGTPLMLADTREAILGGAWNHDLTMIKLH